jgi:hypothetical protein
MAEPGTPAPDLAALFAATAGSVLKSNRDRIHSSLLRHPFSSTQVSRDPARDLRLVAQLEEKAAVNRQYGQKLSPASKRPVRRWILSKLLRKPSSLQSSVSQLSQESRARADGSPVHDVGDHECEATKAVVRCGRRRKNILQEIVPVHKQWFPYCTFRRNQAISIFSLQHELQTTRSRCTAAHKPFEVRI